MTKKIRIGIIGLGTVGEAVVHSLCRYGGLVTRRTSLKVEVAWLCDARKEKANIARKYGLPFTTLAQKVLDDPQVDIVVELIGGIEPAKTFILGALKNGKNVVTANKALLSQHGREIFSLARKKQLSLGFEASVCGAIPLIQSISQGLVACEVYELFGILNGTTNYILTQMEREKIDFHAALKEAQNKGLAEKNPVLDISGIDAQHKLCILSYLCFGVWPKLKDVYTEGISSISLQDILYAREMNYRIKLLAVANKNGHKLDLRVHPTLVSDDHPLSEVSHSYNAVVLDTHPAGELLFYGKGAGGAPTSSAVIADIVSIATEGKGVLPEAQKAQMQNIKNTRNRYYIRLMAKDRPGVLAQVSKILSSANISIASVSQKERKRGKIVPVVMITHEVKEENMRKARQRIDALPLIKSPVQVIRIEDL